MVKDVSYECKRTKNFAVTAALKQVMKKCFTNNNARELPDGSFSILYAEKDNLFEKMYGPTNHIVWGRRGTGKTHLLKAFVENINENNSTSEIAFYITCDRMGRETPRKSVVLGDTYDRVRYYANDAYSNFMYTLGEQLYNQYDELLRFKQNTINTELSFREYLDNVGYKIIEFQELCKKGIPRLVLKTAKKVNNQIENSQKEAGISAEIGVNESGLKAFFKGIFSRKKTKSSGKADEETEEYQYEQYLPAIQKAISDLIDEMLVKCIYVCIDELWLIDNRNPISYQPFFLDNIGKTLGIQPKLSIVIASIRETTNLTSKSDDIRFSYGMKSGHDIVELGDFDSVQNKISSLYGMFKEMMVKRVEYYLEKEQSFQLSNTKLSNIDSNYLVQMIFKEERYFNSLVNMSHGIPRNFLNLLNKCLHRLEYDLASWFVHVYLISEVVIDYYKNELRSDLALLEENTVFNAICEYVSTTQNYFFIIDNRTATKLRCEINTLLSIEIIHRIPSGETPSNIMDKYKPFYVDIGMYLLYVREKNDSTHYMKIISDFQLLLPSDLKENYRNYQINLSGVTGNTIVCSGCKISFSNTHPVFEKYSACPNCGVENTT